MQIKDVMSANAVTIRPEATPQEASEKMRESGVESLPVCAGQRVLGVVTQQAVQPGKAAEQLESTGPHQRTVADLMSPDAVYIYSDQEVDEAARLMEQHGVSRLYVLGRDHGMAGVITQGDLARASG